MNNIQKAAMIQWFEKSTCIVVNYTKSLHSKNDDVLKKKNKICLNLFDLHRSQCKVKSSSSCVIFDLCSL